MLFVPQTCVFALMGYLIVTGATHVSRVRCEARALHWRLRISNSLGGTGLRCVALAAEPRAHGLP